MTNTQNPQTGGFYGLGIAPSLLDVLARLKYVTPTPIQEKAIPVAVQGQDVIGIAQTGTGKTLAFSVPMLMRIAATKGKGLVLLPTRELALQVDETLQKIGAQAGLRTAVLIGGASMNNQISAIKKNPHVIVATPGRLNDHLDQKTVDLSKTAVLVLDEADRMLDMGFAPQINRVLRHVPKERQTMLFSATMPPEISLMAAQYMATPVRVEIARAGTASERVEQELFVVEKSEKLRLLDKLLQEYHGTVLVFSRTKHGAAKITRALKKMSYTAAEIHSNRSLNQRKDALEGFKNGRYRILVATDIAARGIDVTGIELVVNFDLPDQAEDYVHRIGRTGRAGRAGKAISFATPDQGKDVREIEKLVRMQLAISKTPDLPAARAVEAYESRDHEREERNRSRGGSQARRRAGTPGSGQRSEGRARSTSVPGARAPQPAFQAYDQEYRKDKDGQAGRPSGQQRAHGRGRGGPGGGQRRGKMAPRKFFGGMGV
jgi:ATP-dependent RNA helicase RhlE